MLKKGGLNKGVSGSLRYQAVWYTLRPSTAGLSPVTWTKKHLGKPRNPTKIGRSHLKVAAAVGFWPQGKIRRRAFKAWIFRCKLAFWFLLEERQVSFSNTNPWMKWHQGDPLPPLSQQKKTPGTSKRCTFSKQSQFSEFLLDKTDWGFMSLAYHLPALLPHLLGFFFGLPGSTLGSVARWVFLDLSASCHQSMLHSGAVVSCPACPIMAEGSQGTKQHLSGGAWSKSGDLGNEPKISPEINLLSVWFCWSNLLLKKT